MLQQPLADDYVLATGETHSVREFVERAFACVDRTIGWAGTGIDEKGIDVKNGEVLIEIDPRYFGQPKSTSCLAIPAKPVRSSAGIIGRHFLIW